MKKYPYWENKDEYSLLWLNGEEDAVVHIFCIGHYLDKDAEWGIENDGIFEVIQEEGMIFTSREKARTFAIKRIKSFGQLLIKGAELK